MSESIDFVLSAKDQASAVFRKSREELQLLSHQVNATSKQAKTGLDAITHFGNALGAGWISDSVRQFKMLNDSLGKSSELMSKNGASALAMKAGLVGLVAYGSVAVGKMLGDWIFETKKWEAEFQSSIERSRELIGDLGDATAKNLRQRFSDIKEFGGTDEQKKEQAKAFREQLENDIRATKENKKRAQERMEMQKSEWGQFARGTAQRIEETKLEIQQQDALLKARKETFEALNEFIRDDPRDAMRADQAQLELFEQQKEKLKEELEFAKLTKEQIELAKIAKLDLKEEQIAELQILVKQRQEYEAQQEAAERLRQTKLKDVQDQIKENERAIRDAEKALSDAEGAKFNLSRPTLTGSDSRLLTQQQQGPSMEEKQVMLAEKANKIAEEQKKINDLQLTALNLINQKLQIEEGLDL